MTTQGTTKTEQIDLDLLIVQLNDMLENWNEMVGYYSKSSDLYSGKCSGMEFCINSLKQRAASAGLILDGGK